MQWTRITGGLAAFLAAGSVFAQPVPAGWNAFTDVRKTCSIAVPSDWEGRGSTRSPRGDSKTTVTVHGLRAGQTFDDGKALTKQTMPPIKVIQDDAKRLVYTMKPPAVSGGGSNGWYVVVNSTPVCTASFTFDTADEALLRKIADTLAPAGK